MIKEILIKHPCNGELVAASVEYVYFDTDKVQLVIELDGEVAKSIKEDFDRQIAQSALISKNIEHYGE